MNLPEFSVNRRVTVLMLILIVCLFGIISFFRLGLDLFPELEYPFVSIVTTYEGVASEDIETLITKPIEEIVSTVKHVRNVASFSQEGISAVMVEFEWGTRLDFAAQDVRDKVSLTRDFLPEEIDNPLVVKFNMADFPVLYYGITGMENTQVLRDYLDDNIKPRLERLEGVASCMLMGGLEREINILIDRERLQAHHLALEEIIQILRQENLNVTGGHITKGYTEYLVRTLGEFKDLETMRNIVVTTHQGTPIYLKDIAQVVDTHKEIRNYARTNRKDCVLLGIMKQSGANTVMVLNRVKRELERLKEEIPKDIRFYSLWDQGHIIKSIVRFTTINAFQGGILAIILLFLFLRNWRPTFAISLAIPISVLTTFIGMYAVGYTFNLITLMGLALGVGMLVDNAVVVIENTFRHLEEGKDRKASARIGASEVGLAITASTLTTLAVFLPVSLTTGMAARLLRPMSLTICLSLFASLFVALTLVPMVASVIFKRGEEKGLGRGGFERFREAYKRALGWALSHRKVVIITALCLFLLSLALIPFLGAEFMPKADMPMHMALVRMPVGTSLEETNRVVKGIEESMLKEPEAKFVGGFVGLSEAGKYDVAWGMGAAGVNEAQVFIRLEEKEKRKRSSDQIIEVIRGRLPRIEEASFEFMDMREMFIGGGGERPIEVKVFGKDLDRLKDFADRIASECEDIGGLRDIDVTLKKGKPELQIKLDRVKARRMGLTLDQVAHSVKTALLGKVATKYRIGGEEYDIRVRYREMERDSLEDIKNIAIASSLGFQVPLYQITTIEYAEGPLRITREDQERKISVTANSYGRDLGRIIRDIKSKVSKIEFPPGYFVEYGGRYEDMQETFRSFTIALIIGIILVYMVMAALFESLSQPFIIMFTIPLALIGVVFGLLAFGKTLNVQSFMGTIMLVGIVVNNAIVMIDYINRLKRKGIEKHQALIQGAATRLRPILITSSTTILAIFPMVFSRTTGSEMRSSLAVAVSFGLLFSTFLTLFVIPVVYSIVDHISYRVTSRMRKILYGKITPSGLLP